MGKSSCQSQVCGKEIYDPSSGIVWQSLLREESGVDFIIRIQDHQLVVHGAVFIEQELRELQIEISAVSSVQCTRTYEGEVLGFPDVVVIDGDENDPNRNTSDKVDKIFIAYAHA